VTLVPKPIEPEDVGRFSIDDKNNLYWDGHLIHTESILKLSGSQTLLARAVAVAALLGSLATVANATASWLTYSHRPQPVVANARSAPLLAVPAPTKSAPQKPLASLR
jgi:hypothetical protein